MAGIRSILVHLDGGAHARTRLQLAHRIASHHGAALTALFALAPQYLPLHGDAFSGRMPRAVDAKHRSEALGVFEQVRAAGGAVPEWKELDGQPVVESLARMALTSDLLVLGQRDPLDAGGFDVPGGLAEAAIIASGRPTIIVPTSDVAVPFPRSVLVAWKSTPESARALTAALPFLRGASRVHLLRAHDALEEAEPQQLLPYLRSHGIAQVHEHGCVHDADAGKAILALAAETDADLIVMGCYGHSRARELVLGGASRTVIDSARTPVLMSH
jgi:nucleotide-binding universal stress UspA family protein